MLGQNWSWEMMEAKLEAKEKMFDGWDRVNAVDRAVDLFKLTKTQRTELLKDLRNGVL